MEPINLSNSIQKNLTRIHQRIEAACAIHSRSPSSIRLIAVSKSHDSLVVTEAIEGGQLWFGENYLQEFEAKASALNTIKAKWSFIGTLQSNKIDRLAQIADEIQTLTSPRHADRLERAMIGKKNNFPVFISLNAGNEASKSGCTFDEIDQLRDHIEERCPTLVLQGIMAIPPVFQESELHDAHILYEKLRKTADKVGRKELSLGMSLDLELAIQHGSTVVRIGTDIFGPRRKG